MTKQLSFSHVRWDRAVERLEKAKRQHRPTKYLRQRAEHWCHAALKAELRAS